MSSSLLKNGLVPARDGRRSRRPSQVTRLFTWFLKREGRRPRRPSAFQQTASNPESGQPLPDDTVIAWLKSAPETRVSHDLAPGILARINTPRTPHVSRLTLHFSRLTSHVSPLAAAAALVLLLGGLWLMGVRQPDPNRQAVAWLCQTQEADGSWSTARWGGDKHFEVALTGLSLMTLLEEARRGSFWSTASSGRGQASVTKAVEYLLKVQQDNGQFGDSFAGAPYNQGIATLALAKAYESRKDERLRLALDKAILAICAAQYKDGGWGYYKEARPASNLSITLWQIEALRLLAAQGWDVKPRVERGLRWMAGVAADDGSFGYQRSGDTPGGASQTLTAMGAMSLLDPAHIGLISPNRRQAIKNQVQKLAASPVPDMDYYRGYFLAAALKKMDEKPARAELAAIRKDIRTKQVKRGADAGSWQVTDRWASAGGRVYATAMASLSLR